MSQRRSALRDNAPRPGRHSAGCADAAQARGAAVVPERWRWRRRRLWRLPVATRVLHHPADQVLEGKADVTGLLGHQRGRRHAGLAVDFETDEIAVAVCPVVEAEDRPRHAPAAEMLMGLLAYFLYFLVYIR